MAKLINQDMKLKAYAKKIVVKQNGKLVEVPSEVYKDGEWISIQNEFEDEIKLGETTITPTNEQQIILAKNSGLNGFKKVVVEKSNPSFNISYSDTPPADTSKLWLNCNEPSGVEIQNYLGECAVSDVLEYGTIDNPTTSTNFYYGYFSTCYIGNNQIAIVGYNHVRIYDLVSKSYIADYSINVGTSNYYTSNILYKDNILYFGYRYDLYSFDLTTQTLTKLKTYSSDYSVYYLFFNNESEIGILTYYPSNVDRRGSFYILNIETNTQNTKFAAKVYCRFNYLYTSGVKIGDYIYNFSFINDYYMKAEMNSKFNLSTYTFDTLTSFSNFMTSLGWTEYYNSTTIYDNERYIYILGGYGTYNGTSTKSDLIIRYDIANDSCELLDQKLLGAKYKHFNILVDNRIYMFGGSTWTSNDITYGRTNYIDYFDLKYPLNENNAIVTTNTINTDVMVNLINEDTIKLKSNVASAYIGNADNLAEKVNAYYYKITGQEPSGYSGLIFDKNAILENYSTLIEMAESNNMGMLSFPFKNSEGIVYALGVTYIPRNDSLDMVIIDMDINLLFSVSINNNGDFNSTSTYGDCIWVEGDTYTFEFGEYLEFSNEIEGETLTHTMDDFALMGTAIGKNGGVLGKWLGINTSNPFEWGSLQEQNVFLGETKTLEIPYTNVLNWGVDYTVTSDLEVTNNHTNVLTINAGSALGTYPITVTATSSEYNSVYEKTFNVITNNAITWTTIPNQTSTSSNSITLDLSTYYTNNSSYDVTLSASSSDNTNFEVSITGNTLTVNCLAVETTMITVVCTVLGIDYSKTFTLTVTE